MAGSGRRFVVEADGGSRGNPGPAAYGALVRDADTGEVLVETAEHIGRATNNVAEYRGLIAGLTVAAELDPQARVEARMDSLLVVKQMSGEWKIKHPDMRPLALQARAILPADQVRFTWVPREQNRDADRLANEALDAAAAGRAWQPRAARGAGAGGAAGGSDRGSGADGAAGPVVPGVEVDEAEVQQRPGSQPQNHIIGWADLGPPTTFVLLRHGETTHTVEKRFSGAGGIDPPLSDEGRAQAERAGAALAAAGGVDAVVSSPLRRTLQTAEVAARALGLDVRVEDGFRECGFGEWDGCTFAEVQERWPDELAAWLASTAVRPPGGESFDEVAVRVATARDKTVARYAGRTVLVVTHVTPIKTLVRVALGAPPSALYRMELEPASLSRIDWYADGNASMRVFNDASHHR